MQLSRAPAGPSGLRAALRAAACVLLASGAPVGAAAQVQPGWQLDATALLYGEASRTDCVEPIARVTRFFEGGNSFSAQFGVDVITGASPSGAMPSGLAQTTTTPSGNTKTIPAGQVPTSRFQDFRGLVDLEYTQPLAALLTAKLGAHFSQEKDYRSAGGRGQVSLELFHRRTTLTAGGSADRDVVEPIGGTPVGLSPPGVFAGSGLEGKRSNAIMVGLSQVVTRRWLLGANCSRTTEDGYLTEPYKVVSLVDGVSGHTSGELKELRPRTRDRRNVLISSVYHHATDISYLSHRYYWDDWGVRANATDFKYRHELSERAYLQPHVRFSAQTAADFFHYGLIDLAPLPRYATSDFRLGALKSVTLGATYGFQLGAIPGEWSTRLEYLGQWGKVSPRALSAPSAP